MNIDICKAWVCACFEDPQTTIAWMLVAAVIGFAIAFVQNRRLPRTAREMLTRMERTALDNRRLQRLVVKPNRNYGGWVDVTLFVRAKPPETEMVAATPDVFVDVAAKRLTQAGLRVKTTREGITATPTGARAFRLLPKNQQYAVKQAA